MIKTGIIGGAGYTAGELVRLLLNHPNVEIAFVHSASNAGRSLSEVHAGLTGDTEMKFSQTCDLNGIDCLFLCSGHGASSEFWQRNRMPEGLRVIDLSQDFRDQSCGYVYGLPELNAGRIAGSRRIANPGCFATAIQLALLPLAASGNLLNPVHITGITGSTGAGVHPTSFTHFSWRDGNVSVYKPFSHQHLKEIGMSLASVMQGAVPPLDFIPMRGDFTRGIFVAAYTDCSLTQDEAQTCYKDFYRDAPFTHVTAAALDMKQVVNTNKCLIHLEKHGDKLLVESAIDNLLKGASGQAVENFNLMFGLDRKAGLSLKPSAF